MHKRESWTALLAAMVLSATVTTAYAATCEVTANVLNVREGAGTQYAVKGLLADGDIVEVLDVNGSWARVSLGQNGEGFVFSQYIEETGEELEEAAAVMASEQLDTEQLDMEDLPAGTQNGMVVSSSLNFREGPDGSSPLIEALPYGAVVELVLKGDEGGWHYVSFNGARGYVFADYIKEADADGRFFGLADDIAEFAKRYLGYRYVYGGSTPSGGFDCGGLVKYVFGNFGYQLPMGATSQYRSIDCHISRGELRRGDIVYFSSPGNRGIAHTGIYLGDGEFIHASSPGDVVKITSMTAGYYDKYYYGAARLID